MNLMENISISKMAGPNGSIAFERIEGSGPGIVWFGGLRSDMTGTKASYLADWARKTENAFLRFDYTGHGASDGNFEDGCIGEWAEDARTIFDAETDGPQILVGSSMGGWTSLLTAIARPERVAGLILIAPAPDFTARLMRPGLSDAERSILEKTGRVIRQEEWGEETLITAKLLDDGDHHLVLANEIEINAPVHILHGGKDDVVPLDHVMHVMDTIKAPSMVLTLNRDGDHRLSSETDLIRLLSVVEEFVSR